MCSIAGTTKTKIVAMATAMRHRAPDDTGFFEDSHIKLAMGRLKIIDLISPGLCPLKIDRYVLLYNGEVYNYKELRKDLEAAGHHFKTESDTEVLLRSYMHWGEKCLDKFNGMFAFVVYDTERKALFGARDITGEKPLYYHSDGNHFVFASEIKAILQEVPTRPCLHPEFRTFELSTGPDTIFEDIKNLLPGHKFHYDLKDKALQVERYYTVTDHLRPVDPATAVDELDACLQDAVRLRMRADVPVGLYLSGGLDSTLIAAMAKPAIGFTCRFAVSGFDETEYAREVAHKFGIEHVVIQPSKLEFEQDIAKIMWHLDMPTGSLSIFPLYKLAETASKRVKVVLSGEGGDELFGGYQRYIPLWWEEELRKCKAMEQYQSMLDFYYQPALVRYGRMIVRGGKLKYAVERIAPYWWSDDVVNNMTFVDFNLILPSLLQMEDRMSSAWGIENRTPFLDRRLIEFAFSLPGDAKIRDVTTKWLLRQVAKRYLPKSIVERSDKKGLVAPYGHWYNVRGRRGVFDRRRYNERCLKAWERVMFRD